MKVTIGVSNHHVHLTEDDFKILFGNDANLGFVKALNQPGQFASSEKVDIRVGEKELKGLRILGPFRSYTQVELSKTDLRFFKINAPVRESGCLSGAAKVTIVGPVGSVERDAGIIADRHIHITKEEREQFGLTDIDEVSVKISTSKGGVFEHVKIKEAPNSYYEMHIDTDDANGFLIENGNYGEIIL